jgi:hypothetical protein
MKQKNAHTFERHEYDWYVEPQWCTTALLKSRYVDLEGSWYDPSCGGGNIIKAFENYDTSGEYQYTIFGSDIVNRNPEICKFEHDFTDTTTQHLHIDNIISNPPFGLCSGSKDHIYIRRALEVARKKVVLLLPLDFAAGSANSQFLRDTPFEQLIILTSRPSMLTGEQIAAGIKPTGAVKNFAWCVWDNDAYISKPIVRWLDIPLEDRRA